MHEGDVIDRKYELVRLLGEGGMGSVYEALHLKLGRRVALKFLRSEHAEKTDVVARFLREAQAATSIGSEHIVDVLDVGDLEDGTPYIVMEYLEGMDLDGLLDRQEFLEPSRAVRLMLQACRALAAAHNRGIIHRDLKPENLFLTHREDGREWIKVVDFGIAKIHRSVGDESTRLTATGTLLGTPLYMPPEQARGAKNVDLRVDIYALGTILYELITGRPPFEGENYNEVIIRIATMDPLPPSVLRPELDLDLEQVVLTAMAKDPDDRFDSVEELADALLPFAEYSENSLPPPLVASRRPDPDISATADTVLGVMTGTAPTIVDVGQDIGEDSSSIADDSSPGASESPASEGEGGEAAGEGRQRERSSTPARPSSQPPPLSRRGPLIAILATGLFGAAAGVVLIPWSDWAGRGQQLEIATGNEDLTTARDPVPRDEPSTEDAGGGPAKSLPASSGTIELRISVQPEDAVIRIDGIEVGDNPFVGRFPRDGAQHRVEALADGFRSRGQFVSFSEDAALELELEPAQKRTKVVNRPGPRPGPRPLPSVTKTPAKGPTKRPVRPLDSTNPYGGG